MHCGWKAIAGKMAVCVKEKGRNKSFKGFLTEELANWVVGVLLKLVEVVEIGKLSMEDLKSGGKRKGGWEAYVEVGVNDNVNGRFAVLGIAHFAGIGKGVRLCIPEAKCSAKGLSSFMKSKLVAQVETATQNNLGTMGTSAAVNKDSAVLGQTSVSIASESM